MRAGQEEVLLHCGKLLKRSHLWDPSRHASPGGHAILCRILADQTSKIGVQDAEALIARPYETPL